MLVNCGWSCTDGNDFCRFGPLLGEDQSVYRAELRGLVEATERTMGNLEVVTDCQAIEIGARKRGSRKDIHLDLWNRFELAVAGREVKVTWMRAHLTAEEAAKQGYSEHDRRGNDEADTRS